MPLNKNIKKILVIGSGPIVIGQAAEFDYAGTQACRALKEDNIEIVLVNSNPATIMTDHMMADKIYIEPLTLTTIKRIIKKERPDSILSSLGGQTGLTLCMQLAKDGFLDAHHVTLLGSSPETIDKAEDRQCFKDTMESIGEPCIPSDVVTTTEDALSLAEKIGYPVIVRPAFTLGGTGGGMADNPQELREIATNGIALSPIGQILVEKSVAGWKEIEFEVIRDKTGNSITVCSMENFDPVGVHTGDSIVIAPAVTLADKEYQMLRTASLRIVEALKVEGGCNCQFALDPNSFEYAVIEVNPRVSRSSALASKATGYPIAKVATKIAIGYTLDEIKNAVTGITYASFEPAIDYVAVKFPKWPFDKFVYAKRTLGTQMKATGEVMSISDSFESAIMKAIRSAEISAKTLNNAVFSEESTETIRQRLHDQDDNRIFVLFEALKRGISPDEIFDITKIDRWFLYKLLNLVEFEKKIAGKPLSEEDFVRGKKLGYLNESLREISGEDFSYTLSPTYKMVDTCAGEFAAQTPYFYATYNTPAAGGENEVIPYVNKKNTVIVFGSGPIRIGQGIEFDYASVHCVHILKRMGYEVVIVNNNPETVSTDFDTADRLYFEPLNKEDVKEIIDIEKPFGVVVAFGGQTAIKLTKFLNDEGVNIIGTSADAIDMAEDRDRFDNLLEELNIKRAKGFTVMDTDSALNAAHELGFPVLMRPSYVLGGQNMIIAYTDEDIKEYMKIILSGGIENPVLIDKYLEGREIEVDAIFDGEDALLPGIMEHIERSGVHSGDSIAVYPAIHIDDEIQEKIIDTTKKLCYGLGAVGIFNIQYIIVDREIYVIEVNPRASRTVPYLSKVTGVPMVDLAVKVSLGEKLKNLGYGTGLFRSSAFTAVKVPVFSFEKLIDVDTQLGPEMKSTGEVLGIGKDLREALYKGLVAAGYKMYKNGGVFFSVKKTDRHHIAETAKKFAKLGFTIYATEGNADVLMASGVKTIRVTKEETSGEEISQFDLIESGKIQYIVSTSAKGRIPSRASVRLRRRACMLGIPCVTSIDTAAALADSLMSRYSEINTELIDINSMRTKKQKIEFKKMEVCGNDYIYIDCFNQTINSPESLSVYLSDRHYGIGGDGIVLICPSKIADARMKMFNLDGSEGEMSGNAISCVAKYMHDEMNIGKNIITIETKSGIKELKLITRDNKVISAIVDMGKAELNPALIPVKLLGDKIVSAPVKIDGSTYEITCVSMGNPHCVVFYDNIEMLNLKDIGSKFEFCEELFPERANIEFVNVIDSTTLKMRVWERGSGETLSCGTGACAAVVAAVLNGFCQKNKSIRVILPGGDLYVKYTDEAVYLSGSIRFVYSGIVEI